MVSSLCLVRKEGFMGIHWLSRDLIDRRAAWTFVGLGVLIQISHPLPTGLEALIRVQDKLGRSFPSQVWGQGQG